MREQATSAALMPSLWLLSKRLLQANAHLNQEPVVEVAGVTVKGARRSGAVRAARRARALCNARRVGRLWTRAAVTHAFHHASP